MFRISVYGKGGIGKSTVSASLCTALRETGVSVALIGCDPKRDSTMALNGGESPDTCFSDDPGDFVWTSPSGVICAEAGGPTPGKGCAGKGLERMVEALDGLDTDYRVYDVPGDVVCGGFGVPMRPSISDVVIVVTSGEAMALYAARRILGGIHSTEGRALGIVLNRRGVPMEYEAVRSLSEESGVPVILDIPRSPEFHKAEGAGRTVVDMFPDSDVANLMRELARKVQAGGPLYDPAAVDEPDERPATFDSVDRSRDMVFKGPRANPACTSHGAVDALLRIRDAAVVLDGPRNCAALQEMAYRRRMSLSYEGRRVPLPPCRLYSAGLDTRSVVRGDQTGLRDAIVRAHDDGAETVFVVPACAPLIVGEDLEAECARITVETGIRTIVPPVDERFLKGKFGGSDGAMSVLIDLMDPTVPIEEGTVNLINDWWYGMGRDPMLAEIERMLALLGLEVNMRFLDFCSLDDIRDFCRGENDIQLGIGGSNEAMSKAIAERTGRRPALALRMPQGIKELGKWLKQIAEHCGREDRIPEAMAALDSEYSERIAGIRPRLEGKKVLIYFENRRNFNREVTLVRDLGMDLVGIVYAKADVFLMNEKRPKYPGVRIVDDATPEDFLEFAAETSPDLVLTNKHSVLKRSGYRHCNPKGRGFGIEAMMDAAEKFADVLALPPRAGWEVKR